MHYTHHRYICMLWCFFLFLSLLSPYELAVCNLLHSETIFSPFSSFFLLLSSPLLSPLPRARCASPLERREPVQMPDHGYLLTKLQSSFNSTDSLSLSLFFRETCIFENETNLLGNGSVFFFFFNFQFFLVTKIESRRKTKFDEFVEVLLIFFFFSNSVRIAIIGVKRVKFRFFFVIIVNYSRIRIHEWICLICCFVFCIFIFNCIE